MASRPEFSSIRLCEKLVSCTLFRSDHQMIVTCQYQDFFCATYRIEALSHDAIIPETSNAILLLSDVNLASTGAHYILLMCTSHIRHAISTFQSKIALQVARNAVLCDSVFTVIASVIVVGLRS